MEPVRVKVVSAAGVEVLPGVIGADPEKAQPHLEKLGWMVEEVHPQLGRKNPKITLDDGSIIWGCECWWTYANADDRPKSRSIEEILLEMIKEQDSD